MSEEEIAELNRSIREVTGRDFSVRESQPVGGGCINEGVRVAGGGSEYFVKWNRSDRLDMFEAERDALKEMRELEGPRIPEPVTCGAVGKRAFLILEWISLTPMNHKAEAGMGHQLATFHRQTGDRFGWHRDNTIGATPQVNGWCGDWLTFWRDRRLSYQIELARRNGLTLASAEALLDGMECLFENYDPEPSPCHGDLWGGNAAMDGQGRPVLFDPAFYFGDRETDLAFTEMFGGFGQAFYRSYRETWPLDAGYENRRNLYNLYHILNHYNLFGGGYGTQAESVVRSLLCRF